MATRTAPAHMMRPADTLSDNMRKSIGLAPLGKPDPMPGRRTLLEYIDAHGPMPASAMNHAGPGHTPQLIWLQKEGYAECDRNGEKGATWDITALGRRWIVRIDGEPVKPRTIAYAGNATEALETRWPDVRGGASRAFEIQSRGMQ